jgi:hypothetical protein
LHFLLSFDESASRTSMPSSYLWLIPLLPFAGFLINGTLGRKLPRAARHRRSRCSSPQPAAHRRVALGSS